MTSLTALLIAKSELIQMDTDSLYFALSAKKLEEVVKSELQIEFENNKKTGWHGTNLAAELLASSNSSLKGTGQ